jgi:carotenoid cleavage dioxygenase-like enzyme
LLSLGLAAAISILAAGTNVAAQDLPDGYVQILQRGDITAIDEPQFVTADEAEIADDAWVLGLVIDGEARAYSLNLLNAHEIVNDRIGDTKFAAAW